MLTLGNSLLGGLKMHCGIACQNTKRNQRLSDPQEETQLSDNFPPDYQATINLACCVCEALLDVVIMLLLI
uniref:Uncharacterized protein n=1 Tax=Anguilla anguilla TaxID=7936 RepID=A0A0E9W754_ANGAN